MLPKFNAPTWAPGTEATAIDVSGADQTLATPSRGLYVGGSGAVKVDMADGSTGIVFAAMAGGVIHPLSVKKVYQTGTTATGLVAVY